MLKIAMLARWRMCFDVTGRNMWYATELARVDYKISPYALSTQWTHLCAIYAFISRQFEAT